MGGEAKDPLTAFREKFLAFRVDEIEAEVDRLLGAGVPAREFFLQCQQCMEEIGAKFEAGEYYLPELVVSGEMFKKVSHRIRPVLAAGTTGGKGKIVLGTAQGDIHNLGKDIFRVLAEARGITVFDLGVDVPPRAFLDKLEETGATVLGVSALVTTAFEPLQELVRMLGEKGLRDRVRIVIGGGVTTPEMVERLGVDAQTRDAYEGLRIVESFLQKEVPAHATV